MNVDVSKVDMSLPKFFEFFGLEKEGAIMIIGLKTFIKFEVNFGKVQCGGSSSCTSK